MISVVGTYHNGAIKLNKTIPTDSPVPVIITFLEEVQTDSEKALTLSDFSFLESQKVSANFKGSFSDALIEERRTGR